MNDVLWILVTLGIAFACGYVGLKLKIPAGAMVFAMVGVAAFNIFTDLGNLPANTRPILQGLGGAMIGHAITKADVKNLRKMWGPALLLIASMIVLNVGVALLVHFISGITIPTSLFACAPGGVSDMALIADEMGADPGQVSILQLFRLVGICLVYPVTFRFIRNRWPSLAAPVEPAEGLEMDEAPKQTKLNKQTAVPFLLTLACAAVIGFLIDLVKMPAAFMVGGVVGSCAYNLLSNGKGFFPSRLRFFVQAATGGLIGVRMSMESVVVLPTLIVPILVMFITMLCFTALCGFLMYKMTKSDLLTSVMSVTPGGLQEMAILAQDLKCNTAQIVTMHTVRVIAVICFFPLLLRWLIGVLA